MGKKFTYNLEPHETLAFAERMTKVGMKNVKVSGNRVSFYDPRSLFGKNSKRRKK